MRPVSYIFEKQAESLCEEIEAFVDAQVPAALERNRGALLEEAKRITEAHGPDIWLKGMVVEFEHEGGTEFSCKVRMRLGDPAEGPEESISWRVF